MSIKEELRYSSGVNYEGFLTEGIIFFKNSKRIEKLISKIRASMQYIQEPSMKADLNEYLREMERAKLDFQTVEEKYRVGNKEEAREEYRNLRIKFSRIVLDINKESVKKALIITGVAAIVFSMFAAIIPTKNPDMVIGSDVGEQSFKSLSGEEKSLLRQIEQNNKELKLLKNRKEALDKFMDNQKLIEKLSKQQEKLEKKIGG